MGEKGTLKSVMTDEEFNRALIEIMDLSKNNIFDEVISKLNSLSKINIGVQARVGKINGLLGLVYYKFGDVERSMNFFVAAKSFFSSQEEKYHVEYMEIESSIGILFNSRRQFNEALYALYTVLNLSHKYGVITPAAYNNLAVVYLSLKEFHKALKYINLGMLEMFKLKKARIDCTIHYFLNKVEVLINLRELDHAQLILNGLNKTIELIPIIDIKDYYYTKVALFHFKNNELERAKNICSMVIEGAGVNRNTHQRFQSYILMADIHLEMGSLKDCHFFLIKAYELSLRNKRNKIDVAIGRLIIFHEKIERYSEAQKFQKELIELKQKERVGNKNREFLNIQERLESRRKMRLIENEKLFNQRLKDKNSNLQKAIEEQRHLELHLKSLQLQLSPHFIFNTLQSIQGLIFKKTPLITSDYLAKFADLMRAVLNASKKTSISLEEEIYLLNNYIELEQKRFDSKFDFSIDYQDLEILRKVKIPSLLVQPFVENAIVHGLSNVKDGKLKIVFRLKEKMLYIHVLDNGIGRKIASIKENRRNHGESMALKIMAERQASSQDSNNFRINYKVFDRKNNKKLVGTHVAIRVQAMR